MPALLESQLSGVPVRRGKVRDVYDLGDKLLLVATDRISAFDWVMPTGIPDKGRILTQLSASSRPPPKRKAATIRTSPLGRWSKSSALPSLKSFAAERSIFTGGPPSTPASEASSSPILSSNLGLAAKSHRPAS